MALRDALRQGAVGGLVRPVFLAREKAQEWPALPREVITDRPAQHRVRLLERVDHGANRHPPVDLDADFGSDPRDGAQVLRQLYADHQIVCTSTDTTAGRSCTIACQCSPSSADP